jgi:NO-binding membrane sensor protein with MHYT domain
VAEVHHFTYGAINPIAAYLLAFLGSFLGLLCAGRARAARTRRRRNRWLIISAFSIGGGAIFLTRFAAMLGFDVPASPVRYDVRLTLISLTTAVVSAGIGLIMVGHGRRDLRRIVLAGVLTGAGLVAMHVIGMRGVHISGELFHRPALVALSALLAVGAATMALWFTVSARGWASITGAAALIALAVCGTHYTAMSAVWAELAPVGDVPVSGIRPLMLIVPLTLVSAVIILAMALSALQAMTEEEFTAGAGTPRRGAHAGHPWSLREASLLAMRRAPGDRPSPRPTPRPIPPRPAPATAEAAGGS